MHARQYDVQLCTNMSAVNQQAAILEPLCKVLHTKGCLATFTTGDSRRRYAKGDTIVQRSILAKRTDV
jgi:hypothetical protein